MALGDMMRRWFRPRAAPDCGVQGPRGAGEAPREARRPGQRQGARRRGARRMWWARCGRATRAGDACGRGAVWATTTAAARGTGARCGRGRNGAGDSERWRWWCHDGGRVSRRGEGAMGDGRTVPVVAAVVAVVAAVVVVSSCGRSEPKKNECTGDGGGARTSSLCASSARVPFEGALLCDRSLSRRHAGQLWPHGVLRRDLRGRQQAFGRRRGGRLL